MPAMIQLKGSLALRICGLLVVTYTFGLFFSPRPGQEINEYLNGKDQSSKF